MTSSCKKYPHFHIILKLYDGSSGKDIYKGSLETRTFYAFCTEEMPYAAIVKDVIDYWRYSKFISDDICAEIEWRDVILDPQMLLRDICVDGYKLPLFSCSHNELILRYNK
jgi:hypothetical protein